MDNFYIGAYWGSRKESLTDISTKTCSTLQKLSEIEDYFAKWFNTSTNRKKALEKKVDFDSTDKGIMEIISKRVKKDEINSDGTSRFGFVYSFWSGQDEAESCSISFSVGMAFSTNNLSNCCVLSFPNSERAKQRLLQTEIIKKIFNILIEIWNPDNCILTSEKLREELHVGNEFGWFTYVESIERLPKFSDKVIHEKIKNGYLFYLSNYNLYDYSCINNLTFLKNI